MDVKRDGQTRTFDVRTVLSLLASKHAIPPWMTKGCVEEPADVGPLVEATDRWLQRSFVRPIDGVGTNDFNALARVVSGSVRVTAVVPASSGEREYLLITHEIHCPGKGAKWTGFEGSVNLNSLEEWRHIVGRKAWRAKQMQAVFPDVYIRRLGLTAVVQADTQETVDTVVRGMRATLRRTTQGCQMTTVAGRLSKEHSHAPCASDLVVYARRHQSEEWNELRLALLEESVKLCQ